MLLRMYSRLEMPMAKVEVLDYRAGDEAGIKSVTLSFGDAHAYGLLIWNRGSPFGSGSRHLTPLNTSSYLFLHLLRSCPGERYIEVEVRDDDIKMDTFRSGWSWWTKRQQGFYRGALDPHSDRDCSGIRKYGSDPIREPWSCDNEDVAN